MFDGRQLYKQGMPEALIINLDAFDGPLDVLLELAKAQKVDLAQISILDLVDQYLDFVRTAKHNNLELAADYLVMAAVLAYLKSKQLLPPPDVQDGEIDPADLAEALALRLRRLQAMKDAGSHLFSLARLGRERFAPAGKSVINLTTRVSYTATLYDLLSAYAGFKHRAESATLTIKQAPVFKFEQALRRLKDLLPYPMPHWKNLQDFLPLDAYHGPKARHLYRSAMASTLLAGLELTRQGYIELRQDRAFGPLLLRSLVPQSHGS